MLMLFGRLCIAAPTTSQPATAPADQHFGAPDKELYLGIKADSREYRIGEPIELKILLKNAGKARKIPSLVKHPYFYLIETWRARQPVPLTAYGRQQKAMRDLAAVMIIEFAHDEVIEVPFRLERWFAIDRAGQYEIAVRAIVPGPVPGAEVADLGSTMLTIVIRNE